MDKRKLLAHIINNPRSVGSADAIALVEAVQQFLKIVERCNLKLGDDE